MLTVISAKSVGASGASAIGLFDRETEAVTVVAMIRTTTEGVLDLGTGGQLSLLDVDGAIVAFGIILAAEGLGASSPWANKGSLTVLGLDVRHGVGAQIELTVKSLAARVADEALAHETVLSQSLTLESRLERRAILVAVREETCAVDTPDRGNGRGQDDRTDGCTAHRRRLTADLAGRRRRGSGATVTGACHRFADRFVADVDASNLECADEHVDLADVLVAGEFADELVGLRRVFMLTRQLLLAVVGRSRVHVNRAGLRGCTSIESSEGVGKLALLLLLLLMTEGGVEGEVKLGQISLLLRSSGESRLRLLAGRETLAQTRLRRLSDEFVAKERDAREPSIVVALLLRAIAGKERSVGDSREVKVQILKGRRAKVARRGRATHRLVERRVKRNGRGLVATGKVAAVAASCSLVGSGGTAAALHLIEGLVGGRIGIVGEHARSFWSRALIAELELEATGQRGVETDEVSLVCSRHVMVREDDEIGSRGRRGDLRWKEEEGRVGNKSRRRNGKGEGGLRPGSRGQGRPSQRGGKMDGW